MADHSSIGEVLTALREEFPDVTISKIRFLESQGLIDPERTPSGYRKFYAADIERLRWILHQQKDHYLPLKVIKERLEGVADEGEPSPASVGSVEARAGPRPRRDARGKGNRPVEAVPLPTLGDAGEVTPTEPPPTDITGVSMTRPELARAAGLDDAALAELESYGLVRPAMDVGERALFDENALVIARAAARFFAHGVEARHLRMYRSFADREALLFQQVLLPYLRQRNPEGRAKAQEGMSELTKLGRELRLALLREAVRNSMPEA